MELILENVRSFVGRHTIPVKPLTLLTGENSSGKSTFLASFAAVSDPLGFPFRPRFNEPPYSLGNYDTIATYKGGKYGRAKSFSIGYKQPVNADEAAAELVATYIGNNGLIECSSLVAKNNKIEGKIAFTQKNGAYQIEISSETDGKPSGSVTYPFDEDIKGYLPRVDFDYFIFSYLTSLGRSKRKDRSDADERMLQELSLLFNRSRRQRTLSYCSN